MKAFILQLGNFELMQ